MSAGLERVIFYRAAGLVEFEMNPHCYYEMKFAEEPTRRFLTPLLAIAIKIMFII